MSLQPGSRIGPYEVVALLGEGGMGQVFRARDTKLNREVALKVLPDSFANDAERLARFTREAQTLASLNHPNIAHIHGLEESGGVRALVMELVEGEDLSQRIARGPIPVDEALPIAKQIAEALEAAHEQGIIHRDLKPANIKVRPDGTVKVLDFGLAKALEPIALASVNVTASPTVTSPAMLTGAGVLLGTAAYMSPEQARGKAANRRADIWAFGCVLYEMLVGRGVFQDQDVAGTLAAVLRAHPDWAALPLDVAFPIRTLLRGCLEKDPGQRVGSISTVLFVLRHQTGGHATGVAEAAPFPKTGHYVQQRRQQLAFFTTVAFLAGVAAAATLTWGLTRQSPARVVRTTIASSATVPLTIGTVCRDLAISADGARIAYTAGNPVQLFVRTMDALVPTALSGPSLPHCPAFSSDSRWIAFFDLSDAVSLKKVAATGGAAVTLAAGTGAARGVAWLTSDAVIFGTSDGSTGLLRVQADGGTPEILTRPDASAGELDHVWPEVLPDGQSGPFTIITSNDIEQAQVAILDLATGARSVLLRGGSHAQYVPPGYLVYGAAGTLRAVAFDAQRREIIGVPVPVVEGVAITGAGAVSAGVALDGTFVYATGGTVAPTDRLLTWVDRQGREEPLPIPPRRYQYPRLSPDGTRLAIHNEGQDEDVWIWSIDGQTLTRVTFEAGRDSYPVWTADGKQVVFSAERLGGFSIFTRAADGTGPALRLTEAGSQQVPTGVTPDGRVLFHALNPPKGRDLRSVTLDEMRVVESILEASSDDRGGTVSPDGRWLAYESSSSGRFEIYVRPFPGVSNGQWQVSTTGGVHPLWAPTGRELFYVGEGGLMAVSAQQDGSWVASASAKLFDWDYFAGGLGNWARQYDVSPDGRRFLMVKGVGGPDHATSPPQLVVVQNWTEELKRLVPTN